MGGRFWTKKIQFKVIIVLQKTQKLKIEKESVFLLENDVKKKAFYYYYYYYKLFLGIFYYNNNNNSLTNYLSRVYQNPRNEI
jgi:hypothetical protein